MQRKWCWGNDWGRKGEVGHGSRNASLPEFRRRRSSCSMTKAGTPEVSGEGRVREASG